MARLDILVFALIREIRHTYLLSRDNSSSALLIGNTVAIRMANDTSSINKNVPMHEQVFLLASRPGPTKLVLDPKSQYDQVHHYSVNSDFSEDKRPQNATIHRFEFCFIKMRHATIHRFEFRSITMRRSI